MGSGGETGGNNDKRQTPGLVYLGPLGLVLNESMFCHNV